MSHNREDVVPKLDKNYLRTAQAYTVWKLKGRYLTKVKKVQHQAQATLITAERSFSEQWHPKYYHSEGAQVQQLLT